VSTVTKITFPGNGPGEVRIRVYLDGKLSGPVMVVGHADRDPRNFWDVVLWSSLNGPPTPDDEKLTAGTLKILRSMLLKRIARDGKWWQ
jgi:hypothetical protein